MVQELTEDDYWETVRKIGESREDIKMTEEERKIYMIPGPAKRFTGNEKPEDTNPPYYRRGGLELADVLEAWDLHKNAHKHQAVQYIIRSAFKGDEIKDLKKAVWYLEREISRLQREN